MPENMCYFDDAYKEIDIPEFQLTRAILLGGIYQSISKPYMDGLINLDSDLQAKIYRLYDEIFFRAAPKEENRSFIKS